MVAGVFSVVVSFVSDSNIHKASIIVILMRNYSTDVKFKAWGVSLLSSHDTKPVSYTHLTLPTIYSV